MFVFITRVSAARRHNFVFDITICIDHLQKLLVHTIILLFKMLFCNFFASETHALHLTKLVS